MAIQMRRGNEADLDISQLKAGEIAVCLDTGKTIIKLAGENYMTLTDTPELREIVDGKSDAGHTHIKSEVGLGNVDNTSDLDKPVSDAVQTALDGKADSTHTHDDRYYTESEIDEKLSSMPAGDSGTILFDGDESTSETITLSDDVSNYQYIEIFYGLGASGGGGSQGSIKVLALQNTWTPFGICYGTTTTLVYYAGICALQNNTLLRGDTMRTAMNNTSISERRLVIDHGTSGTLTFTGVVNNISVFYLHIYRVVGYK